MADDDPDLYFKLLGFTPSQRQKMKHDMAQLPTPSGALPDGPGYDINRHLEQVQALWKMYPLNSAERCDAHRFELHKRTWKDIRAPYMIINALDEAISRILLDDEIHLLSPITLQHRSYLSRMQARLSTDAFIRKAEQTIIFFLQKFSAHLPESAFEDIRDIREEISLPLYTLLSDVPNFCNFAYSTFAEPRVGDDKVFGTTTQKLLENMFTASGIPMDRADGKKALTLANDYEGTVTEVIDAYLSNTPFMGILADPVPFSIPRKAYSEHAAVFAPSGHGKTQLLQHLITGFLNDPDPPGMFILDSQGDMLGKIERLAVFTEALKDRLIVLDPQDAVPPALNFFQLGANGDTYDAQQNELFAYLFTAIDSDLTAKQGTAVTYLLKLMRAIPGATIETLKDVMEEQVKGLDNSRYFDTIMKLDRITQDFFRNQFFDKAAMGATRQQVARRLYTILGNPVFTKMFAAKENRFSALNAMQEKKIVLINTSQRFLGQEASAVFGRFIIAQCLAAAYDRGDIPEVERHLTLLVVDEASEYFDAKTERILSQARKYGLGLLFATQYLEQMPPQVKAAVNGNTTIKLAGPVAYNDAMMLSREMYTSGEFIRSMKKTGEGTQFACHVRGLTPQAIALTVPYGTLERQPKMDQLTWTAMRAANGARYGSAPPAPPAAPPSLPLPSDPTDFGDRY